MTGIGTVSASATVTVRDRDHDQGRVQGRDRDTITGTPNNVMTALALFGKSSIKADKFVTASHRYHGKHAHWPHSRHSGSVIRTWPYFIRFLAIL